MTQIFDKRNSNTNTLHDIIKDIEREWYASMSKTMWEKPLYSGKQIEKAGKIIANPDISYTEKIDSYKILNNWRAAHAYPLQIITSNLRIKNKDAIVVQRLKRLDSIVGKLSRFPEMNLYRMQDLGGCRVILDDVDQVYASVNAYKNSRVRHILKREYDYIQNPKISGYRSYHMVYQYHSDKNDTYNHNMLIEIQFRTKLQHIWATALETMGVYTKTQLKASQGDKDVLRFFTLVSSYFALQEAMPTCPNTPTTEKELISEIKEIDKKQQIVSRLSALSTAINYVQTRKNDKKYEYYLLILNFQERRLQIKKFNQENIGLATTIYDRLEAESRKDIDVVLVSASSFKELKAAYPNYFADISQFVAIMRDILD